jgi:hypothetical protein
MRLTVTLLALRHISANSPLFARNPCLASSSSLFRHVRIDQSPMGLPDSSGFHHFLQPPITMASKHDYVGQTMRNSNHIFKLDVPTISLLRCLFEDCQAGEEHGGAIWTVSCRIIAAFSVFRNNSAKFAGSVDFQDARTIDMNFTLIAQSSAERFGAGQIDGHAPEDSGWISECNFTGNRAEKWIGGIRIQHNGGNLSHTNFVGNFANIYGALWDYGHKPAHRLVQTSNFVNNSAEEEGAGYTAYHLLYRGTVRQCRFVGNRNGKVKTGRSVFLWADAARMVVADCVFDGTKEEEMAIYFPRGSVMAEEGENRFGMAAQL